jgi:DegV family protein with EDD domain
MSLVRVVTDSACDLPQPLADELGIAIVPLTIRFGADEFVDRRDFTPKEFWARCSAASTLPETAAPAPGQFEAVYRRLAEEGADAVVTVSLSGALSGTIDSARVAATAVSGVVPVTVIDSRSVTLGLGMMAVAAARAAREGAAAPAVAGLVESLAARTNVWGTLDTLDNIKKGGRIGGARALLASVLSIKPIIEVRDGKVEEGGRQRTRSKALNFLVDKVAAAGPLDALAVAHGDAPDVDTFVDRLTKLYDETIVVGDIGAVIGSHSGPGTIGVVYQTKG